MEYKDTLLMPKTEFEMRGKLPSKEPGFQKRWQEEHLYEEMLQKREGCKPFVLHDGPPYANGEIHLGHALNKILKDVVIRNRFMAGYKVPFVPGWDTHGLPIETAIQKLGHNRKEMDVSAFRKLCHEYALKQVEEQKAGFLSLGAIGDYKNSYITLDKAFEARQIEVFGHMAMEGLIYKGLKPVYWSPSSESALAEAEIEYHDIKSPTIFVKFQVQDGKGVLDQDTSFVIWTTTPWTIPANLGICLNKDFTYALVQSEKGKLIVLEELVDTLWETFGCTQKDVLSTFKGSALEMITTKHPLYDRESLVMLGEHVSADAGTGCVHTAPGFGADDFYIGQKYGLPAYCNVDERGCMMEEAGSWLAGQSVDEANKSVTKRLEELGALLKLEFITHSYPHDWRTKKPIIFRATTQWFASIDKIREQLLSEIANVTWIPKWGQQRMHNMIADRGDWCISRQRAWGVPIPIFYAQDDSPIMDRVLFDHVANLFQEHGSNIWFERDVHDLLPAGYTHPNSPDNVFYKEMDTMDVWFDSGSSHTGAMLERGLGYPADVYFEGSDQYRGWFNSSLIIGTAVHGHAPYKQVLSHGFVMDGKGVKMSKSQWNAVAPSAITKKYGADILRLWAVSVDYQADCSMSEDILKQVSENYRKVRNTFRFLLANINKEDFSTQDCIAIDALPKLDAYMIVRLNEVNEKVQKAYQEYRFSDVTSLLTTLMTNDFSAYYLDYTKDILYIEKENSVRRRQIQSVVYYAVDMLLRLWAPILVHTCEEINDLFKAETKSIHLGNFPVSCTIDNSAALKQDVAKLLAIRSDVFKALEEARATKVIGKSLEAHVLINITDEQREIVEKLCGTHMHQWLIVSKVSFTKKALTSYEVSQIAIEKCTGMVCPRCWNISETHAEDGLCKRCEQVLE